MTTAELAIAARDGNPEAFTCLVERYQAMAFGYALATLRDVHLAEDATQLSFLTAYRQLRGLRDPDRFGGWLRGIVHFECLHVRREQSRQPTISLDVGYPNLATGQSLEDEVIISSAAGQLHRLLGQLPERQRIVAALYYLQDQSQAGIAEFLGLPVSTVNNRLRESRQFLRHHGAHLMSELTTPTPDFAATIGRVLRQDGLTIDARLSGETRPDLLTAVRISTTDRTIGAYISQYLDDDVARLIVQHVSATTTPITPGAEVRTSGIAVTRPVDDEDLLRIVGGASRATTPNMVATGIKTIDLFAPVVEGGTVAIVGDRNVGKLVLVDELLNRLAPAGHEVTILVFLRTPDETGAMHLLEYRTVGPVAVVGIPVSDASPMALATTLDRVDTVLAMSRGLGRQHLYPAIDPGVSRSVLQRDDEVIDAARALLADGAARDPRVDLIRAYLTQPFFVAEPYTNRPGVIVSPKIAREDLATLLADDPDIRSTDELMMQGSLADASSARESTR